MQANVVQLSDYKLGKSKILIADDSDMTVSLISRILDSPGYELMTACNGEDALKIASWKIPDLILLDVMMPGMDGYEVCRRLQRDSATRDIPVIFMSVRDEVESKISGFEAGAVDYITKNSLKKQEIRARVQRHLSLKSIRQTIKEQNMRLEHRINDQTKEIMRLDATLGALLERRGRDKKLFEENMLSTVTELLLPYLEKLKNGQLTSEQQTACVNIIESNLNAIASPFARRLSSPYLNLTAREIRVADLVRKGKSNKEIAEIMDVFVGTVMTHRHNVRKKLGLKNRKINLRTFLSSFEDTVIEK